jgi:hypothetical protein
MKPFVLVVIDHDKKEFSVEGPMQDDGLWNAAIAKARKADRNITCSVPGEEPDRSSVETAADACARQYRYKRVSAGAIVSLISQ